MENLLCIKGKIIGKGKPLVCVPVMESSKEEILRETRRLEEAHTEMIEWRVDAFENVESPNAIREILNEMKHIIKESILVYASRSKIPGGCKALSNNGFLWCFTDNSLIRCSGLFDVEYFRAKMPKKTRKAILFFYPFPFLRLSSRFAIFTHAFGHIDIGVGISNIVQRDPAVRVVTLSLSLGEVILLISRDVIRPPRRYTSLTCNSSNSHAPHCARLIVLRPV